MKTIQSVERVEIKVTNEELFEGRWISFQLLSKKLGEIEERRNEKYKSLRNRLYNSKAGKKYNTKEIAGFTFFDVKEPMKGVASLELVFKVVENAETK